MTATTTPAEQTFTVILDDDEELMAEGRIRRIDAGPTWAKHRVRIVLDEGDTSGHWAAQSDLTVSLLFEDDVEGHALSLHFPSAQKADEFRKRLLAGGIVAGALIVGVSAAQLTASVPTTSVVAPAPIVAPAPAPIAQPLTNPRIPAEDLLAPVVAPLTTSPVAQPLTNPRIPAEDLLAPVAPTQPVGPANTSDFRRGK